MSYYDDDYEYDCGNYCGGSIDILEVIKDIFRPEPLTPVMQTYAKFTLVFTRFIMLILIILIIIQVITFVSPMIVSIVAYVKSKKTEKEVKENIEGFKGLRGRSKY